MSSVGRQILVDLSGISQKSLSCSKSLESYIRMILQETKIQMLNYNDVQKQGRYTSYCILENGYLIVDAHTDDGIVLIDCFTSRKKDDIEELISMVIDFYEPIGKNVQVARRGKMMED